MSSTKTKTALIAVAVLLALGIAVVATWQLTRGRRGAPDIQGFWEGTLEIQTSALRLVLKINKSPDGTYTASIDSVDQGAKDIPVSALTLSNDTVRAELPQLSASYQAQLNPSATEMSGEWRQGPLSLPLTLKRTANPSTVAAPLPAAAYARRPESPLQGWWKGTINAGGAALRVVFKITAAAPGKYRATLDSLDQGAKNIPFSAIEFAEPTARMEIESINGQFEGTLKGDGSELDGTWMQAGKSFPLVLQRAEPADDAPVSASAYAFTSDDELQGIWNGTLDAQGTKLRLALKIAKAADGTYTATMDSPDQGAKDIPATTVTFKDSGVRVEWSALHAMFHGRLERGKLTGFWQQGPADFPLDLERTNRVPAASTAKGKN
jgi:hypothetical protein